MTRHEVLPVDRVFMKLMSQETMLPSPHKWVHYLSVTENKKEMLFRHSLEDGWQRFESEEGLWYNCYDPRYAYNCEFQKVKVIYYDFDKKDL